VRLPPRTPVRVGCSSGSISLRSLMLTAFRSRRLLCLYLPVLPYVPRGTLGTVSASINTECFGLPMERSPWNSFECIPSFKDGTDPLICPVFIFTSLVSILVTRGCGWVETLSRSRLAVLQSSPYDARALVTPYGGCIEAGRILTTVRYPSRAMSPDILLPQCNICHRRPRLYRYATLLG